MLYRIWRLTIKELLQLMRNKIMAPLVLIGPLLEMSLIAWATSAPIHPFYLKAKILIIAKQD